RPPPQPVGSSCCQLTKLTMTRMACPLRSTDITPLPRYYGTVRLPGVSLRSASRGCRLCLSLTTAEQVLEFRTRAEIRVTPPVPRTPHGQQPGFRHAPPGERGLRF